jgi:hypothetical protein
MTSVRRTIKVSKQRAQTAIVGSNGGGGCAIMSTLSHTLELLPAIEGCVEGK